MATREDLQDLQSEMVSLLRQKIRDGTATASDLKEANSLLGRNGVLARSSDGITDLADDVALEEAGDSGLENLPPPGTHYHS